MVALKPVSFRRTCISTSGKQERRGGIETHHGPLDGLQRAEGSRNAVVALKRYCQTCGELLEDVEAGTPWWH